MLPLNFTLGYQIFYVISCFWVAFVFSRVAYLVFKRIIFNRDSFYRNHQFSMIITSQCLWIGFIIHALIEMFFSSNLIISFSDGCNKSNTCRHCTMYGQAKFWIM
eukprot:717491_1